MPVPRQLQKSLASIVVRYRATHIKAHAAIFTHSCELLIRMRIARVIAEVLCGVVALCSLPVAAQELHVTAENGIVTMSVAAQKSYTLLAAGAPKTPVLAVICQKKGKKTGHVITFSPGGILKEQELSTFGNSASLLLSTKLGEQTLSTHWIAYGNVETFTYYGKTEPERLAFVHALLNSPNITIEFTPFLTGAPTSSTFDLTGLPAEFDRHPECVAKQGSN